MAVRYTFDTLLRVSRMRSPGLGYLDLVHEWDLKRTGILIQIGDLHGLVAAHHGRLRQAVDGSPRVTAEDRAPAFRIATACEALSNMVYGAAEIAARVGNRAAQLPRSFNQLRKRARDGKLTPDAHASLGDLQWYSKIREIRTELSHYSSLFVAQEGDDPVLVLRAHRSRDDRVEFAGQVTFRVNELAQWARGAVATLDGYGTFLLERHVLPGFAPSLTDRVIVPVYDQNGFPKIKPDFLFEVEEVTVTTILQRAGIDVATTFPATAPEPS